MGLFKGRSLANTLGPGLITAAVVLGPGSITVLSKTGASLGYKLVWVPLLAGILMAGYTIMAARIGVVADAPLLSLVRKKYGRVLAALMGIAAFLVCCSFQAGDNMGVSVAILSLIQDYLPAIDHGISIKVISALFTAICILVVASAPNLYKTLERMMTLLVLVMIVCFLANLLPARPSPAGIAAGLVPRANVLDLPLVIPITATTFSVIAAIYQAYIVRQKGWGINDLKRGQFDAIAGIAVLGGLSVVILITAAAVLHPHGIKVQTAGDMARQLEPLLGRTAKFLFSIGLWGASFSSQMANPIIGGGLLADGLGWGDRFEQPAVKRCTLAIMVIGAVVVQFFAGHMLDLILFAQRITIIFVPLCAAVLLMMANSRAIVGSRTNGPLLNIIGVAGLVTVLTLSTFELWRLFGH